MRGRPRDRRCSLVRLALRELRGGLRGFYVFIACIALGVLAIAAVGSFAASLADGLAREGRVILGGDVAFSLIQREATAAERAFLAAKGEVSAVATLRAMARTADGRAGAGRAQGGRWRLSALSARWSPNRDGAARRPAGATGRRVRRRGRPGAADAARSPARRPRDLGAATIELRAVLASEPDKLAGGIGFGPRLLVSEDALRGNRAAAAGQPGAMELSPAAAGSGIERRRCRGGGRRRRSARCRRPAGKSAAAPMPRRSSSATSSGSPNISRWSA